MELFKQMTKNSTNSIAATTSTLSRALPGSGITAVFYNDGPSIAFIVTGDSAVRAAAPTMSTNAGTAGAMPIPVGQSIPVRINPADTHWAAVSASSSNVYCTQGEGV